MSASCPRTRTSTTTSPGAKRSTSTRRCAGSRARNGARADELLEQVGLAHAADARVRTYSKGMQQRLGIAQALVHAPDVVFLDEPMSGLDPIGRKEVRDLILRLREQRKTVFMNTHILQDVELVCDRVAIIAGGRIRYEGAIQDFAEAGERLTDLLVTSVPAHVGAQLEERFDAQLRGVGDRIEVRLPEKYVDPALALLIEAGARVVSVSPHRASLEQIFMSAVEESRK
jgi:ABC-2 type transport system ATP-binding protein